MRKSGASRSSIVYEMVEDKGRQNGAKYVCTACRSDILGAVVEPSDAIIPYCPRCEEMPELASGKAVMLSGLREALKREGSNN